MPQNWKVKVWGVRGSMPAASRDFMEYGGNTSCFSVDCGEYLVVFDAGSGLTALGDSLAGSKPVHLFISHAHIDHLMGLYGFSPFYNPNTEIHLYGEARDSLSFRQQVERLVGPPYWPVGFDGFRAHVTFHEIGPDQRVPLPNGRTVRTMRGSHPNLVLLYRLESERRSVVYTLDCELTEPLRPQLTAFCQNAGVLIWDASFTAADLALHPGWGHSSWEQGRDLRRDAGAKLTLLTHFNQKYTDRVLRELEQQAREPDLYFAREGMEVLV